MDPTTILIITTLITLTIERIFSWAVKVKKSKCCGNIVEMKDVGLP